MNEEQRVIKIWAEDRPGVLMRVANIITAKGVNIDRLTVVPEWERPGISQITITASLEPRFRQRVVNEMDRLINVFSARDVTEEEKCPSLMPTD
jgi:acetolactate synthase-1/3 small subunit